MHLIYDWHFFAVNNVGQMYEFPETVALMPEDVLWSKFSCFFLQKRLVHEFNFSIIGMILTNIASVTMMSRLLVNDMKEQRKGIIVNVASGTALQPAPYGAVYAASKVCLFKTNISSIKLIHMSGQTS